MSYRSCPSLNTRPGIRRLAIALQAAEVLTTPPRDRTPGHQALTIHSLTIQALSIRSPLGYREAWLRDPY